MNEWLGVVLYGVLLTYLAALQKLNLVNGVLFTGGWAKSGLYFEVAQKIFQVIDE